MHALLLQLQPVRVAVMLVPQGGVLLLERGASLLRPTFSAEAVTSRTTFPRWLLKHSSSILT
jgi:hypothetical protein